MQCNITFEALNAMASPYLPSVDRPLTMQTPPLVMVDPEIMGGEPVFAGTRVPVDNVLGSLEKDIAWDRLLASYPFLTDAHVEAAHQYRQNHPRVAPLSLAEANPGLLPLSKRVVRPGA